MTAASGEHQRPAEGDGEPAPVIRDKRRIDPQTGEVRRPEGAGDPGTDLAGDQSAEQSSPEQSGPEKAMPEKATPEQSGPETGDSAEGLDPLGGAAAALAEERLADLQRLQAEYANYKKRVDRDRALSRQGGVEAVVLDLLPVLDSIEAAREHDELTGGFKLVAEELERLTGKYGLAVYGEVGDVFDPNVHEALMHVPLPGVEVTTVSAVMQKGVRLNDRVLRPARVGVAEPE